MNIERIMVIGSGQMGRGITQILAQAGYHVTLNNRNQESLEIAIANIYKNLERSVEKGKLEVIELEAIKSRIVTSHDLSDAKDMDLVIEAVPENSEIKLDIFRKIDEIAPLHTIFASNTSSLSITELAASTKRPDKVIGLHFFNPVHVMKLIEINIGLTTDENTVNTVREIGNKLNKTLVEVKDNPGFVVNRILIPMINEAIIVLDENLSTAEEIDTAMKAGANHPMGPLALADLIGLDVVLAIMNALYEGYGDSKYRPAQLLKKMVSAGYLGRKTGKGFFTYQ